MSRSWVVLSGLLINLFFFNAFSAVEKGIRVGIEGAYPPFSMVAPNGDLVGFEVDLVKAICKDAQLNCNLVKVSFDALIPSLMAKKVDMVFASMGITEDRKKMVDFSQKYYSIPSRFVHPKSGANFQVSALSLKGKVIGVQKGTTQERYLMDQFKDSTIKHYKTYEEAFLDLKNKRIELYFGDIVSIQNEFLKKSGGEGYEFVGNEVNDEKWFGAGIGAAIRKGEGELLSKVNGGIDHLLKNGEYQKIQKKYFDFNLYQ